VFKGDNREGDHKRSKKNGGSDKLSNIRVISRKKNRKKGTKNAK
jgi:5-methylcytosine-specific restriction endonuclease McrA